MKVFKLIGMRSRTVYFEALERAELHRWLDQHYRADYEEKRRNQSLDPLPEPMGIIHWMVEEHKEDQMYEASTL